MKKSLILVSVLLSVSAASAQGNTGFSFSTVLDTVKAFVTPSRAAPDAQATATALPNGEQVFVKKDASGVQITHLFPMAAGETLSILSDAGEGAHVTAEPTGWEVRINDALGSPLLLSYRLPQQPQVQDMGCVTIETKAALHRVCALPSSTKEALKTSRISVDLSAAEGRL